MRHLITGITFGVPGGVAATPNISIDYDSAGNKTSMTDGLGSMIDAYNTISELSYAGGGRLFPFEFNRTNTARERCGAFY